MKSKKIYYVEKITQILLNSATGNLKVEEIVEQLGVSKKTLYNHFDSKMHLVESVIDYHLMHKIGEIRANLSSEPDPISSLIMVGNVIKKTYNDVNFLIEQSGLSTKKDALLQVYLKHLDNLVEIAQFLFKKGTSLFIFESDLNTLLASQMYLSGLSIITRSNCLLKPSFETQQQQNNVIYYLLKGYCTPIGLKKLREWVDIRVSSSNIHIQLPITASL